MNILLILEFGVKLEDLAADLNVLCRSPITVRKKLSYLKEKGIHAMKPWMIRVDTVAVKK